MGTMTDEEIRGRIRERIAEEIEAAPLTWVYLSFCDATRPKGSQFIGAVVVRAHGIGDATMQAHRRGINPGGEVLGVVAPREFNIPERFANRLLTKAEVEEMDTEMGV